jgi:non-homologous end joining protein Ku
VFLDRLAADTVLMTVPSPGTGFTARSGRPARLEIDEFVEKSEILIPPYYLRPDGKIGHDAFAVIRETIREMNKVAIGRVVLTNREHIIALEPLDKGLMGTLLRYPTKFVPRTSISTRSRTSKSPRICSISPSTS